VTGKLIGFVCAGLALAVAAGYGLASSRPTGSHAAAPVVRSPAVHAPAPTPVAPLPDGRITATSPLTAASGSPFVSDSFTDRSSGWPTGSGKHRTFGYGKHDYHLTINGSWWEELAAPEDAPVGQLGQSAVLSMDKGASQYAVAGLYCERDYDKADDLMYQFFVDPTGTWSINRRNKANLPSSNPHLLARGQTTGVGPKAISFVADCITLADKRTTRLVLFVNGKKAADLTNVAPLADEGWTGGLFGGGDDGSPTIIHMTHYGESTLSTSASVGTAT
jgi:hypothetical protein